MRKPLKSGWEDALSWPTTILTVQNGMRGRSTLRGVPATGEGKPPKAEAQGRYRHETRLEGRGRNKASGG
jgi:hypothetical protein